MRWDRLSIRFSSARRRFAQSFLKPRRGYRRRCARRRRARRRRCRCARYARRCRRVRAERAPGSDAGGGARQKIADLAGPGRRWRARSADRRRRASRGCRAWRRCRACPVRARRSRPEVEFAHPARSSRAICSAEPPPLMVFLTLGEPCRAASAPSPSPRCAARDRQGRADGQNFRAQTVERGVRRRAPPRAGRIHRASSQGAAPCGRCRPAGRQRRVEVERRGGACRRAGARFAATRGKEIAAIEFALALGDLRHGIDERTTAGRGERRTFPSAWRDRRCSSRCGRDGRLPARRQAGRGRAWRAISESLASMTLRPAWLSARPRGSGRPYRRAWRGRNGAATGPVQRASRCRRAAWKSISGDAFSRAPPRAPAPDEIGDPVQRALGLFPGCGGPAPRKPRWRPRAGLGPPSRHDTSRSRLPARAGNGAAAFIDRRRATVPTVGAMAAIAHPRQAKKQLRRGRRRRNRRHRRRLQRRVRKSPRGAIRRGTCPLRRFGAASCASKSIPDAPRRLDHHCSAGSPDKTATCGSNGTQGANQTAKATYRPRPALSRGMVNTG